MVEVEVLYSNYQTAMEAGNLRKVNKLIKKYGIPRNEGIDYRLLCETISARQMDIAKLFIKKGVRTACQHKKVKMICSPLLISVKAGDISFAKLLISRGADIEAREHPENRTSLSWALEMNNIPMIELLMKRGADLYSPNKNGVTPLHNAIYLGKVNILNLLITLYEKRQVNNNAAINLNIEDSNGQTPLHIAVITGRIEIVTLLLDKGANADPKTCFVSTPIQIAIKNKNTEIAKLLIKAGADVLTRDLESDTVLHIAAEKNDLALTRLVISRHGDINAKNFQGYTPFRVAIEKVHTDVAKYLYRKHADINTKDTEGITPFHVAVAKKEIKTIKLLLNFRANINCKDRYGNTVLHTAMKKGNQKIIRMILDRGGIPTSNNDGVTPFLLAVEYRRNTFVELLYNINPFVNFEDENGLTPLMAAAAVGSSHLVKKLINYGAQVDARIKSTVANVMIKNKMQINVNGYTPLHWAILSGNIDIVDYLMQRGASVFAFGNDPSPLHVACRTLNLDVIKLLLKKGANINANTNNGSTPLIEACEVAELVVAPEIINYLLEKGADVNAFREDTNPLRLLLTRKCENLFKLLISKGADIHRPFRRGFTLLHVAVKKHNKNITEFLLKSGANINAKTTYGYTPLHYAAKYGYTDIAKIILSFDPDLEIATYHGSTPLLIAAEYEHDVMIRLLLKHGSDINATDQAKNTALNIFYDSTDDAPVVKDLNLDLVNHIIKLQAANQYVTENHFNPVSLNDSYCSLKRKECEEEIIKMKKDNIQDTCVSFYDILTKDVNKLSMYANNEAILKVIHSEYIDQHFRLYGDLIRVQLKKAKQRNALFMESLKFFQYTKKFDLPAVCAYEVLNHLSNDDLKKLISIMPTTNAMNIQ